MPLFLSDEEYELCRFDTAQVAERADQFIRDLHRQLETVRAEADAASIAAEHTCSLLEQRYAALSADYAKLQAESARLSALFEQRLSELAEAQAEKHNLHLKAISKDGEIERLTLEASEQHKSKRQLLELVEQKDIEIGEKNATIQSYLDKIIHLTDNAASKEARLHENEAELARCRAEGSRLSQEKELIAKHNEWLNDELTVKVNSLIELRRTHMDYEADMSAKLSGVESKLSESSKMLKQSEERVRELESKLKCLEEEFCKCKDAAATNEDRFIAELSTVSKLAELHKESSEEWSRKAGELEGVIKALETHLSQVQSDYKGKLEKELSSRREFEKEVVDLRDKLDKCELELEKARKANELSLLPLSSFEDTATAEEWIGEDNEKSENGHMIVPKIPAGVSGTALAASLLRSGWSLAKMYEKYQEAADALRHERWERKHSEAILERVLREIEEKAELILDEREQHVKMVEAYSLMNQKLQQALSVHDTYENTIRTLKAELKRTERHHNFAEKEIGDLQKQVTVLLKECRDIQLRCGVASPSYLDDLSTSASFDGHASEIEKSTSEHLLSFKDIHGLVEQNAELRRSVHRLSDDEKIREAELRENFEMEIQKVTGEAAAKVEAVLRKIEEQGQMIESLHSSVAMYRRLYDEERRCHSQIPHSIEPTIAEGKSDLLHLFEGSQEVAKKAHQQLVERIRTLEEDLARSRNDLTAIRSERDKMVLEANFSREKLDSFMKEFEYQREQANGVSARNVELTQLLVDHQRRLREATDSFLTSEECARKLSMEVSVLKCEREILVNSEKKASEESRSLSERVHRLQSTLDAIRSADEVREDARRIEKIKIEEYAKHIEREWAEAKKELQEERDHVRKLTVEREKLLEHSLAQVEEMRKQLAEAWQAVSSAESRAAVSEAHCADLEARLKAYEKVGRESGLDHSMSSNNAALSDFWKLKEEMDKLKEEAQANKDYMLQYKEIARTNETALKNMETAHEEFKVESEKLKKFLEEEVLTLRGRVAELEKDYMMKSNEASLAVEAKEEALGSAFAQIEHLKQENSLKMAQIVEMEAQISALKETVEEAHQRWRNAQNNYERQVILQSETIQEMTRTSQALSSLQDELSELRKLSDTQKVENELLKTSWEAEKSTLQQSKNEAERKYNEVDDQNKILHTRLEALHIKLANLEHSSSGTCLRSVESESQGQSDLQHVINYLRRSKEIAETEVSLLKQEKLRLQSQLDSALKASEAAQSLLRSEREKARVAMFTEEEFKSLQLQVREINLLRESNAQLREESKYNFEECQKLRETTQKAKLETEQLGVLLRNEESEIKARQKEIEMLKIEKAHLESEITEVRESSQKINLVEYDQLKNEFPQAQAMLKEKESEIESMKHVLFEKQENISHLQQELLKSKMELDEREKKMSDGLQMEEARRVDIEKQKKLTSHFKKKFEAAVKEKEELNKDNFSLQKQLEDFKSGKWTIGEGTSTTEQEEKEKEKDTRLQMLEKMVEREREDSKKEKQKRQRMEKTIVDTLHHLNQERKKLEEEIEKHRQSISCLLESSGMVPSQIPSHNSLDEQAAAYFQAHSHFEEIANSALSERAGSPLPPNNEPTDISADASVAIAGQQVSNQLRLTSQQGKAIEQRERKATLPKPSVDARKRKLVRPSLEQSEEPAADVEISEAEGLTTVERGKHGESHEQETQENISMSAPPISSRKRIAPSSQSELKDDLSAQMEDTSVAAPLKKPKGSETQESTVAQPDLLSELLNLPTVEFADVVGVVEVQQLENEIIDNAEAEYINITKELAQSEEPVAGMSHDVDSKNEYDATAEADSVKSKEAAASLDDFPTNEGQDVQQYGIEAADEREEGELVPDTHDQTDGGESEGQPEIASGEVAAVGSGTSETGDGFGIGASDVLEEDKNVKNENVEEVVEGSDKLTDHVNDNDFEQSPLVTLGSPECSPNIPVESASETANPSAVSVVDEGDQQTVKNRMEGGDMHSAKSATEEVGQQATRSRGTTTVLTESRMEGGDLRSVKSGTEEVEQQATRSRGTTTVLTESRMEGGDLRSVKSGTEEVEQQATRSGGTTIVLTERARERALMRQAGIGRAHSPPRGRGRGSGSFRGRGARGVRGGRGQSSGE